MSSAGGTQDGGELVGLHRRVLVPLLVRALATVVPLALVSAPGGAATVHDEASVPAAARAPQVAGLVISQVVGVRDALGRDTHPRFVPGAVGDRARTALWDWPLVGAPPVARSFDPPGQRWLPGHRGIDLAGVAGEQVLAVDAGVVTFSGTIVGVGMVSVTHEDGLRSTYQPVEDRQDRGARVGRGQRLGVLGTDGSHCALRPCLHLGAVRGPDAYIDPLLLLLGAELALLPLAP